MHADGNDDIGGSADPMQEEAGEDPRTTALLVNEFLQFVRCLVTNVEVVVRVLQSFVVEHRLRYGIRPGAGVEVHFRVVERRHGFRHEVDGTVGSVVGQVPALLQLLPDGPDLVHEGVVDEKERIVRGVVQGGQGVRLTATHEIVDSVVHDLELHLEVAVVRLLQHQQHLTQRRMRKQLTSKLQNRDDVFYSLKLLPLIC